MLRRLTAFIAMLALLAVLAVLVWQVYEHHRHGYMHEPAMVVKFALKPALIA